MSIGIYRLWPIIIATDTIDSLAFCGLRIDLPIFFSFYCRRHRRYLISFSPASRCHYFTGFYPVSADRDELNSSLVDLKSLTGIGTGFT